MDQAERCGGEIHYQIEIQGDDIRRRLSCKWTVPADDWGNW